jgi:ABC-type branched-subunit amino acid transport system ATPase component
MAGLLEVQGLTVRYGGLAAVDGVSLSIERGSFVGLIGPNGAGKTTLIDAVTGLAKANGTIIFDERRIDGLSASRRAKLGLARTFQSLELFEELSVRENLLVTADPGRWYSAITDLVLPRASGPAARSVDQVLELVGLTEAADALPDELSLGQRKLITVGRGLAGSPKLLLLDEPAAGLDSHESVALGEKLRDVVSTGTTILLVDHDMGLVLGVCDQIEVLEFGKLIASGTPRDIRSNDRVIHAYLGADESESATAGAVS